MEREGGPSRTMVDWAPAINVVEEENDYVERG